MNTWRGWGTIVASLFLFATATTVSAQEAKAPGPFNWTLTNRFRLLSEADEKDFGPRLRTYIKNAERGSWSFLPSDWQADYARMMKFPYKTHWNALTAQYDLEDYVQSQNRPALLRYARGVRCVWSVNGVSKDGSCGKGVAVLLKVGVNSVSVTVDGSKPLTVGPVEVKDYFSVVIGDSTASGEGNPEVTATRPQASTQPKMIFIKPAKPAQWLDERCHRSLISGPLMALYDKSQADPHASVTVIDYACSGAEIDNGIMDGPKTRPYQGRETPEQVEAFFLSAPAEKPLYYKKDVMLPAQVAAAEVGLCKSGSNFLTCPHRSPDSVIVITGANDLNFSTVLMNLILHCRDKIKCFKDEKTELDQSVKALPDKFQRLHERLKKWSPHKVLLVGYVDPTHNEKGQFCSDNYYKILQPHFLWYPLGVPAAIIGAHLDAEKSGFAEAQFVKALGETLSATAAEYREDGWTYISSHTAQSRPHGVCSKRRWVLTYEESASKQGVLKTVANPDPAVKRDPKLPKTVGGVPSGAMHPNVFGHLYMSRAIERAL